MVPNLATLERGTPRLLDRLRQEVRALLAALKGTPRLVAAILYGGGLRLLQALRLRIKDIDFAARLLVVREGKGGEGSSHHASEQSP